MRLEEIALSGFQSYGERQFVDIDEHVTLLAGRNNVGKSAFLRALQIPVLPQEGATKRFELEYTWSVDSVDISDAHSEVVQWILSHGSPLSVKVAYRASSEIDGRIQWSDLAVSKLEIPGLAVSEGGGFQLPVQTEVTQAAHNHLLRAVRRMAEQVLYLAPRRVETDVRQLSHQTELLPDARNLADVLLDLQLSHRFDTLKEVEAIMQSAFPGVRGFSVIPPDTPSGQLQGEPNVYFEGRAEPIPLRLCGTGLEQMLASAVGVLTARGPKVILIDEPQAYLHPHAERSMLRLLEVHPEHQFVVATHSHLLLGSQPLSRARLLSLEDGRTRVAHVTDEQHALEVLEVSAADLWLVDRLLWVEGPTEERVFELVASRELSDAERTTLGIHRMPDTSRFAARSPRKAEGAYRFCAEVARAIAPIAVQMMFVFDRDEKTDEFIEKMSQASGDRAAFLTVREIENLLLVPELIQTAMTRVCEEVGEIEPPTLDAVENALDDLLGAHDDPRLYPGGAPADEQARTSIKGSHVLERLWQQFLSSEYRKVEDGERLARIAKGKSWRR